MQRTGRIHEDRIAIIIFVAIERIFQHSVFLPASISSTFDPIRFDSIYQASKHRLLSIVCIKQYYSYSKPIRIIGYSGSVVM